MPKNTVLVASAAYARARHRGDQKAVDAARTEMAACKIEQTIDKLAEVTPVPIPASRRREIIRKLNALGGAQ